MNQHNDLAIALPITNRLEEAIALHHAGKLQQAQAIYEEILGKHPVHPQVLNLSGAIALQTGNPQRAADLFGQAVEVDPDNAVSWSNRGLAAWQLKQLDAALASYDRAIALKNDVAEVHFNRGEVLRDSGALQAALVSYQRCVAIEPGYAEAHVRCGDVWRDLRRWQEALASYDRAVTVIPDFEEAFFGRGAAYEGLRQWDAALASYNRAIALKSDYARAHFHRSNVLARLGSWDTALASYDQVIGLDAGSAEAYCNRGIVLKALKRLDAALASFDRAIALRPDYAEAHSNRGNVLRKMMRLDSALASFDRAIALKPGFADAHFNRSLVRLLRGDLENGWLDYEWRWRGGNEPPSSEATMFPPQPLWRGEPLSGKTVLLYGEQGLGDTLQFCRYVELVAGLGAKVVLQVPRPLQALLTGLEGAAQVVATGEGLPAFDYHCSLLSLPRRFNTDIKTVPAPPRYLFSDPIKVSRWRARLAGSPRPRIGLVWSGSALNKRDDERSLALEQLLRYLPSGPQYTSLQKEVREHDRRTLQSKPEILDWSEELHDFSDTAALCEQVDLVISVDTSVAHLSCALGKNTWILLQFVPDWRWLLNRKDTPWYPTARLYRQERYGDWDSVLERVKADIERKFNSKKL